MTTASSTALPSAAEARSAFLRARLASALAILPLGGWTVVHLWNNLSAFQGADAWQTAVTTYPHPFAEAFTGILVLVPLAIHTVWGIGRMISSRPNLVRYRFYGNLKYVLQRVAGLGLLVALGAHLWLAMLHPRIELGHAEEFQDIAQEMHFHRPTLVVYILLTLGLAFHLANGLQTFSMGWGIVSSRKGLRRLEWLVGGIFVVLLAMGWGAVYALWAAGAAAPL
jgi:succinate dehydrogenase / fumarate reductase, cytochrome b subunit